MGHRVSYFAATRHPWPCLLFLVPLLAAYEGGVLWLGGPQPDAWRTGVDTWLRWALESFGFDQVYWPPVLLAILFFVWSCLWWTTRPGDLLGVTTGMMIESVVFALGLWGISRSLGPMLENLGIKMQYGPASERAVGQIITFVGAGIYEEVLFRLLLLHFWL